MKQYLHTHLRIFYPAGIERLQFSQTNVQPKYDADYVPAKKENDQMNKKLILTVLIVLATLILAACAPRVTSLSPDEGAAYAAEVDEYVESLLVGESECDFAMATRGYDPKEWEGHLDETTWQKDCQTGLAERGPYQSKTLDHVEDQQGLRCVIYRVVYEKNSDVPLRVCFYSDDPDHLIVGIKLGK